MATPSFFYFSLNLFFFFFFVSSLAEHEQTLTSLKGVDIEKPVLDVSPSLLLGNSDTEGVKNKNIKLCERVQVSGISRLNLRSYANSYDITLAPSVAIPERLHTKIKICFHRNNTLGWCQCEKDEWRGLQKGIWSAVMSPYETRYVDVKIDREILGSVIVALEEGFQQWRLVSLAVGLILLLLAPIISTNSFGVGSFLLHQLFMLVSSFGMSEKMHHPVALFVLLGIILAGAALGYWIVWRFVILKEDGTVDAEVAQFVKWAMRIIGATFVLQSTLDTPLAIGVLISCRAVCLICSLIKLLHEWYETSGNDDYSPNWARGTSGRAKFLSKSPPNRKMWNSPKSDSNGKMWNNRKRTSWSDSPVRGIVSPSFGYSTQTSGTKLGTNYYSTFHKTGNKKKFTKEKWDDFTRDSTKQALAELAASPEFTDWFIEHADRIKLLPSEYESDSTEGGSKWKWKWISIF